MGTLDLWQSNTAQNKQNSQDQVLKIFSKICAKDPVTIKAEVFCTPFESLVNLHNTIQNTWTEKSKSLYDLTSEDRFYNVC